MRERIIFVVDTGQESGCELIRESVDSYITRLDCTKHLLARFVLQKLIMNSRHEFGICCFTNTVSWHLKPTNNPLAVQDAICTLAFQNLTFPVCNLTSLFELIMSELPLQESDYSLRVILIYARSHQIPICPSKQEIEQFYNANPKCFIDTVYLHDVSEDSNSVVRIFDVLGCLENSKSKHVELTRHRSRFLRGMTELLSNPLQRLESSAYKWVIVPED